ncbi:OLC1v1030205C1 [Oldenlandia corymbosa var. corymbosa]|uniref:OLC1v1030205C1 n=1 Tax=Oldenlandia corymbosa var. corymbosa TaxID=529605 RepID=A0AAV1CGB0_OLDCO|nr:OLC1v1030205C1 [Oldenlandia corymbosa var. corymbosa]
MCRNQQCINIYLNDVNLLIDDMQHNSMTGGTDLGSVEISANMNVRVENVEKSINVNDASHVQNDTEMWNGNEVGYSDNYGGLLLSGSSTQVTVTGGLENPIPVEAIVMHENDSTCDVNIVDAGVNSFLDVSQVNLKAKRKRRITRNIKEEIQSLKMSQRKANGGTSRTIKDCPQTNGETDDENISDWNDSDDDFDDDPFNGCLNKTAFQLHEGGKFEIVKDMLFESVEAYRKVLYEYSIMWGFIIIEYKTDATRVIAYCDVMAEKIVDLVRADRNVKLDNLRDALIKLGAHPSNKKLCRARMLVAEMLDGSHGDSWKLLPKYFEMVKQSNPGMVAKIEYSMAPGKDIPNIMRAFIGFKPLANGNGGVARNCFSGSGSNAPRIGGGESSVGGSSATEQNGATTFATGGSSQANIATQSSQACILTQSIQGSNASDQSTNPSQVVIPTTRRFEKIKRKKTVTNTQRGQMVDIQLLCEADQYGLRKLLNETLKQLGEKTEKVQQKDDDNELLDDQIMQNTMPMRGNKQTQAPALENKNVKYQEVSNSVSVERMFGSARASTLLGGELSGRFVSSFYYTISCSEEFCFKLSSICFPPVKPSSDSSSGFSRSSSRFKIDQNNPIHKIMASTSTVKLTWVVDGTRNPNVASFPTFVAIKLILLGCGGAACAKARKQGVGEAAGLVLLMLLLLAALVEMEDGDNGFGGQMVAGARGGEEEGGEEEESGEEEEGDDGGRW